MTHLHHPFMKMIVADCLQEQKDAQKYSKMSYQGSDFFSKSWHFSTPISSWWIISELLMMEEIQGWISQKAKFIAALPQLSTNVSLSSSIWADGNISSPRLINRHKSNDWSSNYLMQSESRAVDVHQQSCNVFLSLRPLLRYDHTENNAVHSALRSRSLVLI